MSNWIKITDIQSPGYSDIGHPSGFWEGRRNKNLKTKDEVWIFRGGQIESSNQAFKTHGDIFTVSESINFWHGRYDKAKNMASVVPPEEISLQYRHGETREIPDGLRYAIWSKWPGAQIVGFGGCEASSKKWYKISQIPEEKTQSDIDHEEAEHYFSIGHPDEDMPDKEYYGSKDKIWIFRFGEIETIDATSGTHPSRFNDWNQNWRGRFDYDLNIISVVPPEKISEKYIGSKKISIPESLKYKLWSEWPGTQIVGFGGCEASARSEWLKISNYSAES